MLSVEMERDMAPGDDAACCILEDLIEWRTQRLQQIALQHKARAEEHSSRLSILGLTLSCHDNELLALNAVEAGALGERPRLGLGEAVRVEPFAALTAVCLAGESPVAGIGCLPA